MDKYFYLIDLALSIASAIRTYLYNKKKKKAASLDEAA